MVLKKILKLLACSRDKEVEFNAAKWNEALDHVTFKINYLKQRRVQEIQRYTNQIISSLQNGESEEECALALAGYLIRERTADEVNERIMQYCQTISEGFYILKSQRTCPSKFRAEFGGLCFAATRWVEIPELKRLKRTFEKYFGREFKTTKKLSWVQKDLFPLLSREPPSLEKRLTELRKIASTNNINWRYSRDMEG